MLQRRGIECELPPPDNVSLTKKALSGIVPFYLGRCRCVPRNQPLDINHELLPAIFKRYISDSNLYPIGGNFHCFFF